MVPFGAIGPTALEDRLQGHKKPRRPSYTERAPEIIAPSPIVRVTIFMKGDDPWVSNDHVIWNYGNRFYRSGADMGKFALKSR